VLWVAAIGLLAACVSVWFAVVVFVLVLAAATPAILREVARRRRLQTISARAPGAADAAWRELLDECADRGRPIPPSDTVRTAGLKVAQRHHLDEPGRDGLRAVIGVVERSWYGGTASPPSGDRLATAFDELRRSLRRTAPLSWRGRLFPRSQFRRR
jgi:hypothetical protein